MLLGFAFRELCGSDELFKLIYLIEDLFPSVFQFDYFACTINFIFTLQNWTLTSFCLHVFFLKIFILYYLNFLFTYIL